MDARPRTIAKDEKQVSIPVLRPPHFMIKVGVVHTESGFLLATRNYKISSTVGVMTVITTPLRAIPDTGAGPSLISEKVLPEDWRQ
jgi:hypothetical protein